LIEVMQNPRLSAVARVQAAKVIIDCVGLGQDQENATSDDRKELDRIYELLQQRQQELQKPSVQVLPSPQASQADLVEAEFHEVESGSGAGP